LIVAESHQVFTLRPKAATPENTQGEIQNGLKETNDPNIFKHCFNYIAPTCRRQILLGEQNQGDWREQ
jgi:hypothetical protein